ncbi:hypothetical protein LX15_004180 [Streptoalloteichus tenebrarius]|uniref:Uncharacterized protein n=1 Tax=Streptoalloteichus tenebrarius (strain ATCC 17920 / DSM 40477 / JCM 4838 / CBS 697.72 / NBRC 16177 / NCIMB 11028 / NRRL B-12390 / A12253. 1 / ISP 5477) TaxID=1933 RepID=A0ABT1HY62_STRSD|nr:hypothetical protein [Streptoalloteichus tenebrarius]MCP2260462.1 hypothetical protein [Streptoalloteichus tenebrarius]BFF02742.1 hypothetical protein GCM10020241_44170 [Streptoalloteichus tenebrarius]
MRGTSRLALAVLVAALVGLGTAMPGAAEPPPPAGTPVLAAPAAAPRPAQPATPTAGTPERSSEDARQPGDLAEDKRRLVIGLVGAVLIAIVFYGRRVRKKRSS